MLRLQAGRVRSARVTRDRRRCSRASSSACGLAGLAMHVNRSKALLRGSKVLRDLRASSLNDRSAKNQGWQFSASTRLRLESRGARRISTRVDSLSRLASRVAESTQRAAESNQLVVCETTGLNAGLFTPRLSSRRLCGSVVDSARSARCESTQHGGLQVTSYKVTSYKAESTRPLRHRLDLDSSRLDSTRLSRALSRVELPAVANI